jgi:outer membrane protein
MSILQKAALSAALAAAFASTPAAAYEAGDFIFRLGPAGVFPSGESDELDAIPGAKVEADDAWSLGITATYMFTDRIGLGILGAWPFEHDIEGKGSISNLDTVAETKHLPPTVTLQWHIPTGSNFHPYIGAGVNYTYFFDEDTKGALKSADIDIDNSFGLAGEAGVDISFQNDWLVSAQVWYIGIEPEAKIKGAGLNEKIDVEIDPWVFMAGIGKRF